MEKLIEYASKLGLEGKALLNFISEQQVIEREERARERDVRKAEAEADARKAEAQLQIQKVESEQRLELERLATAAAQRNADAEAEQRKLDAEAEQRKLDAEQRKLEAEERRLADERRLAHELQLRQIEVNAGRNGQNGNGEGVKAKTPKLPNFVDGKDDMDSYLLRFERFAEDQHWEKDTWASSLSALLTGAALEVYGRMSNTAARDYEQLKRALYKRYDLTEDGFRRKLRNAKPENCESPEQFIVRLSNYLQKWIELSETEKTYEGIVNLVTKEQFINSVSRDLAVYLKEKAPADLDGLAKTSDQYLIAHDIQLATGARGGKPKSNGKSRTLEEQVSNEDGSKDGSSASKTQGPQCYRCEKFGHISRDCMAKGPGTKAEKRCFMCDKTTHEVKDCPKKGMRVATASMQSSEWNDDSDEGTHDRESCCKHSSQALMNANCVIGKPSLQFASNEEFESCVKDGQLMLANGKSVRVEDACYLSGTNCSMPVTKGMVGTQIVDTLRDTGCSGVVVRSELVRQDQLTGELACVRMADGSLKRAPMAQITVDTPFLCGSVEAVCFPGAVHGLLIGNIQGARAPNNPNHKWHPEIAGVTPGSYPKPPSTAECCKPATASSKKDDGGRQARHRAVPCQMSKIPQTTVNYQHPTICKDGDQRRGRRHPSFFRWAAGRMKNHRCTHWDSSVR